MCAQPNWFMARSGSGGGGARTRSPRHTPPRLRQLPRLESPRPLELSPLLELLGEQLDATAHVLLLGEEDGPLRRRLTESVAPSLLPIAQALFMQPVQHNATLVIQDAHQHPLMRDNAFVKTRGIRGLVGAPLTAEDGATLGALCVWDDEAPREWGGQEVATVERWRAPLLAHIQQWRAAALADARAELQGLLLSTITDPLLVCDQRWHIAYANSPAVELVKRPLEDEPLWEALPEWRDGPEEQALRALVQTQSSAEIACQIAGAQRTHQLRAWVYPSILGVALLLHQ